MSEGDSSKKDFRSSYYFRSLHLAKGPAEKSQSQLEGLLKMEVIDLDKLRLYCLNHTLPVYCRALVWKILLGVLPVYTHKETTTFILDQQAQQFSDLRHGLQVMGKLFSPCNTHRELEQVAESPDHTVSQRRCEDTVTSLDEGFVLIHLLETNKLLTAAENSLRRNPQVTLKVIAEALLSVFDEEDDTASLYWIFSGFVKMRQTVVLPNVDKMVSVCLGSLAKEDMVLYGHLNSIKALNNSIPLNKWFSECFASELPETCLESIWDRVIAGSCMVLVYVAVAILLSVKRRILGVTSAADLSHVLQTIPKENFTAIVSKGLQLWEKCGSPLSPS